jgi:hypothetical protein
MARFTYAGYELQPLDGSRHFFVYTGLDEPAAVRGDDTVVPGAAGQAERDRVKDHRLIEIRGVVAGAGASEDVARQSYRTRMNALLAVLLPLTPADFVIHAPAMGIPTGKKWTIRARYVNMIPGDWMAGLSRVFSIQFESVASPPEWVETNDP